MTDMHIFEFKDYKAFFRAWLNGQPNAGRGLLTKIAKAASMSPAMLTHVFNGDKNLSLEAANDVAVFIGLSEDETDYFLKLVQFSKAGTHSLRERYRKAILRKQKHANEIGTKLNPDRPLSEMAKTLFYSHWLYSGIRNMSACPDFDDIDKISAHLNIPRAHAQRVIDFLLENNLCVISKGKLSPGPQITHIGNENSLVSKHHQNWRLSAMTKMFDPGEKNVFFTSPMSLSKEDADLIRQKIPSFIEEIRKTVGPSKSEVVRCLNIDWFEY